MFIAVIVQAELRREQKPCSINQQEADSGTEYWKHRHVKDDAEISATQEHAFGEPLLCKIRRRAVCRRAACRRPCERDCVKNLKQKKATNAFILSQLLSDFQFYFINPVR